MVYSPTLNDGEDKEVARIRSAQGLPETSGSEVLSKAWKGKGGMNEAGVNSSMGFFQSKGWTREQAAGITANLGLESNFDPAAVGDSKRAYGMGQWHQDRQNQFAKWAGHPIQGSSREEQLGFVNYELTQGQEQGAGDSLRQAKSAREAGDIISRKYERPADANGDAAKRAAVADVIANSPSAPAGPYSQGAAQSGGTVKVEIEHKNAPDGLKTKVKSEGNVQASSRIAYSGVGATV